MASAQEAARVLAPPLAPAVPTRHPRLTDRWGRACCRFLALGTMLLGLAAGAAGQPVDPGVIVQTLDLSLLTPPSPDPAGIAFLPGSGDLLVADSEVDEMTIFQGTNLWELSTSGVVGATGATTVYSDEPTGLSFDPVGNRIFVSDDNQERIFEVLAGVDGQFGTVDDVVTWFDTLVFGSDDPEGVAYDTLSGHLWVVDGEERELHRVDPGLNGLFDGVPPGGDDVVTVIDIDPLGIEDAEGIVHDETTDTLLIADRANKEIYELSTAGALLRTIDPGFGSGIRISGIAIAPAPDNPARRDLFVTDRAVDNNADPNENDGKVYQVAVIPLAGNAAPVVDAGPDQTIGEPNPVTVLAGNVTDDGHPMPPGALTVTWTQISGPGSVTFDDAADPATPVTLPAISGFYVLELEADDDDLVSSDQVTIKVVGLPSMCGLGVELVPVCAGLYALRRRARSTRR